MNLFFITRFAVVFFAIFSFFSDDSSEQEVEEETEFTIVPEEERISELETRKMYAKILSYDSNTYQEALDEFLYLKYFFREDPDIYLDLGRLYIALQKYRKAKIELLYAKELDPTNPLVYSGLGEVEAFLGHPKDSKEYFSRSLALSAGRQREELLLTYATSMQNWGAYYCAEKIHQDFLKKHPDSDRALFQLGFIYWQSQQFEQAEKVFLESTKNSLYELDAWFSLIDLKLSEKSYAEAVAYIEQLERSDLFKKWDDKAKERLYLLKGNAHYLNNNYCKAVGEYQRISCDQNLVEKAYVGIAKTYWKLGEVVTACYLFQRALMLNPKNTEAKFYIETKEKLIDISSAEELTDYARYSLQLGSAVDAFTYYQQAVLLDPDYFPAQVGYGEVLVNLKHFSQARIYFLDLLNSFPESTKILLNLARLEGAASNYRAALDWYERLIIQNPYDSVVQREKARVWFWIFCPYQGSKTYETALYPSVDSLFYQNVCEQHCDNVDIPLPDRPKIGSLYHVYECYIKHLTNNALENSFPVDETAIKYFGLYKVQKTIEFEKRAKLLNWQRRFFYAKKLLKYLIQSMPWNEEAQFDLAQLNCTLGLKAEVKRNYRDLLQTDPLHNLAKRALCLEVLHSRPIAYTQFSYWKEKGEGQFATSQIRRMRQDLGVKYYFYDRYTVSLQQMRWYEVPTGFDGLIPADGQMIEGSAIINPHFRSHALIERKHYSQRSFGTLYTGGMDATYFFQDYFKIDAGIRKTNEVNNLFSIQQRTQALTGWGRLSTDIDHNFSLSGLTEYSRYNDSNDLYHLQATASALLTNPPHIIKVIGDIEWRDARKLSRFIIEDDQLVDIIHPYWTPDDYYAALLTGQWRYEYSPDRFCGGLEQYFDMKLIVKADTANNPGWEIDAEWVHEFRNRWKFNISLLVHRSKLWNAEGLWAKIQYQY